MQISSRSFVNGGSNYLIADVDGMPWIPNRFPEEDRDMGRRGREGQRECASCRRHRAVLVGHHTLTRPTVSGSSCVERTDQSRGNMHTRRRVEERRKERKAQVGCVSKQ